MKGLLGLILDNSKDFDDFVKSAEKQGFTIKPSFKPIYERYKEKQHIKITPVIKVN